MLFILDPVVVEVEFSKHQVVSEILLPVTIFHTVFCGQTSLIFEN